jgi:hypothetical protein
MLKVVAPTVTPVLLFFFWSETQSLAIFALNYPAYQLRMIDERNREFRGMRIGREMEKISPSSTLTATNPT